MSSTDSPQVSRGLLVTLGAVIGVGALALLYLFVVQPLLGGDDVAVSLPPPVESPSPEPGAPPVPGGTNGEVNGEANGQAGGDEPVSETFEVFTARDPFQQLVVPASSGGGDGGGGGGDGGDGGGGTEPTPTPTETDTVVGGTTIRLVDVFTDGGVQKILVTVNGTGYEVAEGETFAQHFRVLDITGSCATLLFGDSRFTLCQGEQIRK